jgi:hypothetical protein
MPEPGFVMLYLGWHIGWRGPRMTGSLPLQRYRDIISCRCTILTLLGIDSYMIAGIRIDLLNASLKGVIMAERLSDALIVMEVGSLRVIRSGLVRIAMVPKEGMPAPIITANLGIPTSHAWHINATGTQQPIVICLPWRYSWKSMLRRICPMRIGIKSRPRDSSGGRIDSGI